jgi:hypothetical protein
MATLLTPPTITTAAMSVFKDFDIYIYAYCERALLLVQSRYASLRVLLSSVSNSCKPLLSHSGHFPNYRPVIPRIATRKAWSRGCESDRETRLNRRIMRHPISASASKACLLSCAGLCWRSGRGGYRIWLRSQRRPQSAPRLWPSRGACIELKGRTRGLAATICSGLSYVSTFFAMSRRAPAFDGET